MRLLTILFVFCLQTANGQFGDFGVYGTVVPPNPCPVPPCPTVNLVMPAIDPLTDFSRPSGSTWNENSGVQIVAGLPTPQIYYRRFTWADCESSTSQGNYSKIWSNGSGGNGRFRQRVCEAVLQGQLFAFGIMQFYPEVCSAGGFSDGYNYDGFCSTYPQYVHNLMQAESNVNFRDFNDGTNWIPAYNSPNWQARWAALQQAIMNWFDTAMFTPASGPRAGQAINLKNVIAYVDVRGIGSYGEWHSCCLGNGYDMVSGWPGVVMSGDCFAGSSVITTYGKYPSPQTMKNIIDATVDAFTNYPCVIIINVLDGWRFCNTKISPEVGAYALTKSNNFGRLGFRRDQWGDNASYYHSILENNNDTYNGIGPFKDSILTRYKWNYFTGEPPGYNCNNDANVCRNGVNMGWIPDQVQTLHAYNIGNGNWGGNAPTNQSSVDSIKKAWRLMGSRVLVTGGTMTDILQVGGSFNVTLFIQNIGLSTEHRTWTTQLVLKNSVGTTVWTGTHNFQVNGFNPSASATNFSTNFTLSGATAASGYNLYIQLVDPLNYAQPYPLGNTGGVSGQYLVRSNITVSP
jgi:hypothetical protein